MPDHYKNIVYPGASIIPSTRDNIQIGDVIYNLHEDFHHSILFLQNVVLQTSGCCEII